MGLGWKTGAGSWEPGFEDWAGSWELGTEYLAGAWEPGTDYLTGSWEHGAEAWAGNWEVLGSRTGKHWADKMRGWREWPKIEQIELQETGNRVRQRKKGNNRKIG